MTALRRWVALAVVGAAAALLLHTSAAQEAKPPATDEASKKAARAGDVELLSGAWRLADFGKEHKSPEAYLAAADLVLRLKAVTNGDLGELNVTPEVQDEKGNPVKGAKVETAKAGSLDDMAKEFFEAASGLGLELGMSKEVETLVKAAKARSYLEAGKRGARGGPKTRACTIAAHATHAFHIAFDPHSVAAIGFRATAPLRVEMRTSGSLHFDQRTSVGNYSWVPPGKKGQTAAFVVRNPHGHSVQYQLFTN